MTLKDKVLNKFKMSLNHIKSIEKFKLIKELYNNKNGKIAIILLICVLFLCGSIYGNISSSKNIVIKKIENALIKENPYKLIKLIEEKNGRINLNKKDIQPLLNFYSEDKNRISSLIKGLQNDEEINSLKLIKKDAFLHDKYYLSLDLANLNIESNFKDSKIYLNDEYKGDTDSNGNLTIPDLVPGNYNLKIEKKSQYSKLIEERNLVVEKNYKEKIPLNGIMISLTSNFPNAYVYVNNKNTELTVNAFKEIGPFPTDGSIKIRVIADTPWGKISSSEVPIESYPEIKINIDLKNDKIISELNETINDFYNSVFNALNSKDKNSIVKSTKEVKEEIYNILKKKYFIIKNSYKIGNLQIKMENSEIEFKEGNYSGNIVVNVTYKVEKKILGIPIQSKSYSEDFFTKVRYTNGLWEVYELNNFSLNGLD